MPVVLIVPRRASPRLYAVPLAPITSGAGMVNESREAPFFLNRGRPTRAPARAPVIEANQLSKARPAFCNPETSTRRGTVCSHGWA